MVYPVIDKYFTGTVYEKPCWRHYTAGSGKCEKASFEAFDPLGLPTTDLSQDSSAHKNEKAGERAFRYNPHDNRHSSLQQSFWSGKLYMKNVQTVYRWMRENHGNLRELRCYKTLSMQKIYPLLKRWKCWWNHVKSILDWCHVLWFDTQEAHGHLLARMNHLHENQIPNWRWWKQWKELLIQQDKDDDECSAETGNSNGRFRCYQRYISLVSAEEIKIKMAQSAKPVVKGGHHLPAKKRL